MKNVFFIPFLFMLLFSCKETTVSDENGDDLFTESEKPKVTETSLAPDSEIGIESGNIVITFSEEMMMMSKNKITLNESAVESVLNDNKLTVTYPKLSYDTEYELKIGSGALKGQKSNLYAEEYILKFRTKELVMLDLSGAELWEVMKYGLFVHFVYGEEYGLMTPMSPQGEEPKDINEFADSFDVEKFADDVENMGFEYVIFTAWHANMNLLYPSEVMKKWRGPEHTSNRDLLGDLCTALNERGIYLMLYSHIWVGNDFHPNDGKEYFYWGNTDGIITEDQEKTGYVESVINAKPPTKWDTFVNEVYDEMSARYGNRIIGHWFDGTWCWHVDKKRIMETISMTNPGCAFVANGDASHGLPYSSKEVNRPARDDYGFADVYPEASNEDATTWPNFERNVAFIQGGNWWASKWGKPKYSAEDIFRYTVLEAGVNTGGGVSWAFAPFVNGEWEGNMLEVMKKAYSYISPIAESIKKTRPSTAYPTEEHTRLNNLEKGYVATMSIDEKYHYVHVMIAPDGKSLNLPKAKDGSVFKKAVILKDKTELALESTPDGGYSITLPESVSWDIYDTVIRLEK